MSWYLTVRPDPNYSRTANPATLATFLRSLPELTQTGANQFQNAPGQPRIVLTLAMSDRGSYADDGRPLSTVNLVDIVCSDERDARWYDALARRIAAFLGWEALDEHAARSVWPITESAVETDCPVHGTSRATAVCHHFAVPVRAGDRLAEPVVPISFETDGEAWSIRICAACAAAWDFPVTGETLRGDAGLDRVTDLDWEYVCARCFESLQPHAERASI